MVLPWCAVCPLWLRLSDLTVQECIGDEDYAKVFNPVLAAAVENFKPMAIAVVCGTDALASYVKRGTVVAVLAGM